MPYIPTQTPTPNLSAPTEPPISPEVLVIGGLALDTTLTSLSLPQQHTSNPCKITSTPGGVAHNLHLALHRSGTRSHLLTTLGPDPAAKTLSSLLPPRTFTALPSPLSTAQYIALNTPAGDLHIAGADMNIIAETLLPSAVLPVVRAFPETQVIIVDANVPVSTLSALIKHTQKSGQKLIFEPTSIAKCVKILPEKMDAEFPLLHTITPLQTDL